MRQLIFVIVCSLVCSFLSIDVTAQTDSTETYDIVYLKEGGALKGEIVVFEEEDGDITFRDIHGRMYSLSRDDYDYFIEDKVFAVKQRGAKVLRARKEEGIEVGVGFSAHYLSIDQEYVEDGYYLQNGSLSGVDVVTPINFRGSIGNYFNRQNYLGLNVELAVFSEAKSYYSLGLRYAYQYDNNTRNTALYLPIEVNYASLTYNPFYQVNDTSFTDGGFSIYTDIEPDNRLNTIDLKIGQGLAFILPNEKSIAIELLFSKSFLLKQEFLDFDRPVPAGDHRMSGVRFSFIYNI